MTCQRLHVVRIVRRQALGYAGEATCTDFTSEPTCHGYGVNDWQLNVTYWTTRPFWLADHSADTAGAMTEMEFVNRIGRGTMTTCLCSESASPRQHWQRSVEF